MWRILSILTSGEHLCGCVFFFFFSYGSASNAPLFPPTGSLWVPSSRTEGTRGEVDKRSRIWPPLRKRAGRTWCHMYVQVTEYGIFHSKDNFSLGRWNKWSVCRKKMMLHEVNDLERKWNAGRNSDRFNFVLERLANSLTFLLLKWIAQTFSLKWGFFFLPGFQVGAPKWVSYTEKKWDKKTQLVMQIRRPPFVQIGMHPQ